MKVLHLIASTGTGGAEQHVLDLCRHQQQLGLIVVVALPAVGALTRALSDAGITWVRIAAGGRWNPLALWSLRQVIRRQRPDVVHAHMPKSAAMASRAVTEIPCVATAHNMVKHLAAFHTCSWVICVSNMVHTSLLRLGYPATRTSVIHNAIDLTKFGCVNRITVRQRMGWDDTQLIVLCVARLVPAKGQELAIIAFGPLAQRYPGMRLVFAGEGPDQVKLMHLTQENGVSDRVQWLGNRSDIAELMAGADVYLQPSIKEGFGIACLEAMASGLACIGTQTGAMPEMLDNGVNGVLLPAQDSIAIRQALESLASDAALRQRLALAAQTTAHARFSLTHQARATLLAYEQAIKAWQQDRR